MQKSGSEFNISFSMMNWVLLSMTNSVEKQNLKRENNKCEILREIFFYVKSIVIFLEMYTLDRIDVAGLRDIQKMISLLH